MSSFAAVAAQLRGTGACGSFSRTEAPVIASAVPLYTPLVTVLAIAYTNILPFRS